MRTPLIYDSINNIYLFVRIIEIRTNRCSHLRPLQLVEYLAERLLVFPLHHDDQKLLESQCLTVVNVAYARVEHFHSNFLSETLRLVRFTHIITALKRDNA